MDRARLIKELEEAERELQAATKLSEVNAAARRLQRAKAALKEFDGEAGGRPQRPAKTREEG